MAHFYEIIFLHHYMDVTIIFGIAFKVESIVIIIFGIAFKVVVVFGTL